MLLADYSRHRFRTRGHKDAAFARSPRPARIASARREGIVSPSLLCAHKRLSKRQQKGRRCERSAPLTLVGSPPLLHLLDRSTNTMDPPLKFAGRRTGADCTPGRGGSGAGGCGRSGGEPRDAWALLPFSPGYRSTTTRKGYVFKQLLFQNGVSRCRANQSEPAEAPTPPWAGAKHHCARNITSFQFTGIFHNSYGDSLELFCHDTFIYKPKTNKQKNHWIGWNLPDVLKLNSAFSTMKCERGNSRFVVKLNVRSGLKERTIVTPSKHVGRNATICHHLSRNPDFPSARGKVEKTTKLQMHF